MNKSWEAAAGVPCSENHSYELRVMRQTWKPTEFRTDFIWVDDVNGVVSPVYNPDVHHSRLLHSDFHT